MPFDPTWEAIFQTRSWGCYPSEDVVRMVAKRLYAVPDRGVVRVLDLGCGGGAHSWYLAREGFNVTAVDGSLAAVRQTQVLLEREQLKADVRVCGFLDLGFPDATFDAVLDCSSVQHNPWDDIVRIHEKIVRMLTPGGWFFGLMLNTDSSHQRVQAGNSGEDLAGFRAGSITRDVFVHLVSRKEVDVLMSPYERVSIDIVDRTTDGGATHLAHYVVAAQKS